MLNRFAEDSPFGVLLREERLMALGPGSPNPAARSALQQLDLASAFAPHTVRDRPMAEACLAGIWLYHDYLDESHRISQDIPTPTGSFWHGILHRREPDSWNSKYWFDRVGLHPVYPALCSSARALASADVELAETRFLREQSQWQASSFIDLCEAARLGQVSAETLCRKIQLAEWRLLFEHCYRQAVGA